MTVDEFRKSFVEDRAVVLSSDAYERLAVFRLCNVLNLPLADSAKQALANANGEHTIFPHVCFCKIISGEDFVIGCNSRKIEEVGGRTISYDQIQPLLKEFGIDDPCKELDDRSDDEFMTAFFAMMSFRTEAVK